MPIPICGRCRHGALTEENRDWRSAGGLSCKSCQDQQSVSLPQTPTALYTSPRVESGHILSMRILVWNPDDADIINADMPRWIGRSGPALRRGQGYTGRAHGSTCQGSIVKVRLSRSCTWSEESERERASEIRVRDRAMDLHRERLWESV